MNCLRSFSLQSFPSDNTKIRSVLGGWLYAYEIPEPPPLVPVAAPDSPDEMLRRRRLSELRAERTLSLKQTAETREKAARAREQRERIEGKGEGEEGGEGEEEGEREVEGGGERGQEQGREEEEGVGDTAAGDSRVLKQTPAEEAEEETRGNLKADICGQQEVCTFTCIIHICLWELNSSCQHSPCALFTFDMRVCSFW